MEKLNQVKILKTNDTLCKLTITTIFSVLFCCSMKCQDSSFKGNTYVNDFLIINGTNQLQQFHADSILKYIGKPDSIIVSTRDFYEEFGYTQTTIIFGKSKIVFDNDGVSSIMILDKSLNINNIGIGYQIGAIPLKFYGAKIGHNKKKLICYLFLGNEDVIKFKYDARTYRIEKIIYSKSW